jgi:hypothetical protein
VRRTTTLLAAAAAALALTAGPALAMQPPGHGAQDRFGCFEGTNSPIAGHPGAAGLVAATPKVQALTGNDMPTAWNAVAKARPIELGHC